MEVAVVISAVAIALFISAYITKRRFGLLGLALATGSILSGIWGENASLIAGLINIPYNALSTAIILSAIILLPPVVLLFHGYAYKSVIGRIVGAAFFTLLALAFLVGPLEHVLNLRGLGADIYDFMESNQKVIIGFGLIFAVVDLLLTKPAALANKDSH